MAYNQERTGNSVAAVNQYLVTAGHKCAEVKLQTLHVRKRMC